LLHDEGMASCAARTWLGLAWLGLAWLAATILICTIVRLAWAFAAISGVKRIIFPTANRADWDELEDYIREGITPFFAENYKDVFAYVFPSETSKDSKRANE
jgi:hypothetical protein